MLNTNNEPQMPKKERFIFGGAIICIGSLALGIVSVMADGSSISGKLLSCFCFPSFLLFAVSATTMLIYFYFSNDFTKGFKYGWTYFKTMHALRRNLLNAGFFEKSFSGEVLLPIIHLEFSNDLATGLISIQNSVHFDKTLEDINISSALGNYVLERSYPDPAQNAFIYEIYDYRTIRPLHFDSLEQFREVTKKYSSYEFFTDARSRFDLQHMLIVGQTGSGKTYGLYCLLLQMVLKSNHYHLYFADPKGSSLYVLGKHLNLDYNCRDIDDISLELVAFDSALHQRASELAKHLSTKLDSDYRNFNLEPHVLVIDEFVAYMSAISTYSKAERDRINSYLRDIVLMGRQLGFFIIIVMQKSDATTIPTALRDNLTVKIVLGEAEDTTYTTTFGSGIDIPEHKFHIGEGVYIAPGSAHKVRLLSFPKLDFDILNAFEQTKKH